MSAAKWRRDTAKAMREMAQTLLDQARRMEQLALAEEAEDERETERGMWQL